MFPADHQRPQMKQVSPCVQETENSCYWARKDEEPGQPLILTVINVACEVHIEGYAIVVPGKAEALLGSSRELKKPSNLPEVDKPVVGIKD
ncbi:hypothetical protein OUZ56_004752 [Daphnia magna]|uniref:Uncharacterized protein n=1 Tax=Daphnia magna TaxID=35525 RepID=A0ABQ9YQT2_9CRUS|nr:hypothetical protein OUZ56_004752 [Daphnia magna]